MLSSTHRPGRAAAVALVAAAPLAAFWIIGDQSIDRDPAELDHMWRLDLSTGLVTGCGVVAAAIFVAAGVYLLAACRPFRERPARLVGSWAIAGGLVAGIVRAATAGVVGANIGGALAVMFGFPIVAAVVGYGAWPYVRDLPAVRRVLSRASARR